MSFWYPTKKYESVLYCNKLAPTEVPEILSSKVSAPSILSDESAHDASWGTRSGTDDDRDDLNEIISAELNKTGNHGDSFGNRKHF